MDDRRTEILIRAMFSWLIGGMAIGGAAFGFVGPEPSQVLAIMTCAFFLPLGIIAVASVWSAPLPPKQNPRA